MAHLIWKETKQQPGTAGPGNMLGCCLTSFHFLLAILSASTVATAHMTAADAFESRQRLSDWAIGFAQWSRAGDLVRHFVKIFKIKVQK